MSAPGTDARIAQPPSLAQPIWEHNCLAWRAPGCACSRSSRSSPCGWPRCRPDGRRSRRWTRGVSSRASVSEAMARAISESTSNISPAGTTCARAYRGVLRRAGAGRADEHDHEQRQPDLEGREARGERGCSHSGGSNPCFLLLLADAVRAQRPTCSRVFPRVPDTFRSKSPPAPRAPCGCSSASGTTTTPKTTTRSPRR